MSPRRRFTKEQQENILKARIKQARACARGNHHWWPDYGWDKQSQNRTGLPPQCWTIEQRHPMPDWDGESLICTGHKCNIRGNIKNISPKEQQNMKDIVKGFIENTIGFRKQALESEVKK